MAANVEHFFTPHHDPYVQRRGPGPAGGGFMGFEGGDLVYARPAGGAADGWLLIDTDPASAFYGLVCHGDPQTVKLDTELLP